MGVFSKNYSTGFFVEQLDDLVEKIGMHEETNISLIGFSMGCIIAAAWALKNLHKIGKLVLVSPAGMLENKPRAVK